MDTRLGVLVTELAPMSVTLACLHQLIEFRLITVCTFDIFCWACFALALGCCTVIIARLRVLLVLVFLKLFWNTEYLVVDF